MITQQKKETKMEEKNWFKKHTDTVAILGAVILSMLWMNTKFNSVEHDINALRTDMKVMKTVLFMKNVMPSELCKNDNSKD